MDASFAYTLVKELQTLAKRFNKMIFLEIHQPSSRIYKVFDNLLLQAHGNVVYFGEADLYGRIGYVCEQYYNSAEFYMDMLNSDADVEHYLGNSIRTGGITSGKELVNETRHGSLLANDSDTV